LSFNRHAPRSPLFPYTTLFRSLPMAPQTPYSQDLGDREPLGAMREAAERMRTLAAAWSPAEFERSYAPGKWSARQIFIHLAQTEDRKSTRLNSSHVSISYAVFC